MKVIFYVTGPTASGKSTAATRLASSLELPLIHADLAYSIIHQTFDIKGHPGRLTEYQLWDDPQAFGISGWGNHSSIWGVKEESYRKILSNNLNSSLIIEGFTLGFLREREIIEDIVGPHIGILLNISPSFDNWCKYFEDKFQQNVSSKKNEYLRLLSCFEFSDKDIVLNFSSPEEIDAHQVIRLISEKLLHKGGAMESKVVLKENDIFMRYEEFEAEAFRTMETVPENKNKNYWNDYKQRWVYHSRAIELIKKIGVTSPNQVLELGTMGCNIIKGSQIMDYDQNSEHLIRAPDILHDARCIPWPIKSKSYEWFIALRVFHHLWPVQRECFEEARRIAKNVLLVVPPILPNTNQLGLATPITPQMFREWSGGIAPTFCEPIGQLSPHNPNFLYLWTGE